ncbi:protein of unknown function DUF1294 [Paenibacillus curdlanolyticus YK9]|uniref:DUF1294 domain-containing protein n=1 Tax=Paenibacillus curdlanolyticus YK9 TaxID=717606 RepID=E0I696_9BACL|nr:DUF1294 domain-containing protein [Paenibacillus curdlanolyticus]EFM12488.1 protein of unknown function DUF1294 [Paenibacillus curdlanolyticus YK9]
MFMIIAIYYIVVNIVLWGMMGYDKKQARHRGRRIPERRLLTYGLIGGAFGGVAAMRAYRHKTKHPAFSVGLPAMAILHIAILYSVYGTEFWTTLSQ